MKRKAKTLLFYSNVRSKDMFSIQRFYSIDIEILKNNGYNVKLSNTIFDFFKFWEYDLVFIYFYRIGLLGAFIATLFNKKTYFTGGVDFLDRNYANGVSFFIQKILFKACNCFSTRNFIVSSSDLLNIKSIFKKEFNNYIFCPHVIDFLPDYNFSKSKIITTVVWMGNDENVYRKGILNSIKLFKSIHKIDPEYKMYIIGYKGKGSNKVEKFILDHNLNNFVFLTGSIDEEEKLKLLQTSIAYFQLSVFEGFGLAAIEALALGNVVVHTGKGGLNDGISEFGIKLDNSVFDFDKSALEILNLINSENEYNFLIRAGVNHINNNYVFNKRLETFKKYIL
jgi:glycosyltransferase involved in cell wall biosynthesis